MKKFLLTKEGKEKLEAEYQHYVEVLRPNVIRELSEARAQGDLSENADYDAAKKRQSEIEGRIAELEAMLQNYEIINSDNKNKNVIKLGSKVKILDLSEDEKKLAEKYKIEKDSLMKNPLSKSYINLIEKAQKSKNNLFILSHLGHLFTMQVQHTLFLGVSLHSTNTLLAFTRSSRCKYKKKAQINTH